MVSAKVTRCSIFLYFAVILEKRKSAVDKAKSFGTLLTDLSKAFA